MRAHAMDYSQDRPRSLPPACDATAAAPHDHRPAILQSAEIGDPPAALAELLPPSPNDAAIAQSLEWQAALAADDAIDGPVHPNATPPRDAAQTATHPTCERPTALDALGSGRDAVDSKRADGSASATTDDASIDSTDPSALLTSLTAAPPSQLMPTLGEARAASPAALTAQREATAEQIPELPAPTGMAPRDGEPGPDPAQPATADQPTVEVPPPTSPEAPAPDVAVPELPPPPPQPATRLVEGPAPAERTSDTGKPASDPQLAESAKASLAAVQLPAAAAPTADAPAVALAGEADPARMTTARADAGTEVDTARGQATTATRADFGEHAIAPAPDPATLTATTALAAAPAVDAPAAEAPALPAEMWAGVDAQAQAPLAAKLTAERDRYAAGQQQFETDRDAARADADGKIETLEADAATEQAAARDTAQAEVDTAREDWRAEVDQVEADARADADAAQAEHTTQVEQERTTADTEAAGHLTQAEKDAAAKTADADKAAAAKKQEGEKESGGFWGWVKSKAKAFIDGIKSAVNAIYDGLRAAVKAVFEAAKALALAVIEAARKVIVGLIKALGELLKAIVKVALAAFPKLADKFCALIDAAVDKATTLVNTIADGLKTAVTAVLDFLASTLDKILSIVQDLYNAAFTLIGMLITGEWKAIVEGLGNLVAAAKTAPGQFEAAALEELLGGDLDQPLDHATLIAAGRTPPGMAEGEGMASATDATEATEATAAETPRPSWTEANVGVDAVAQDYPLSPELMADIEARLGGAESIEFGHSDDPDRNLSTLLGQDAAPPQQTEGATKTAPTPDDGLSPRERADVKWTLMKQGLAQWWSDNWPLVLAGGVLAIGGFIAANILTGGAVLAALPGLMTALGAIFAGVTAVHLVGHLRDYLQKGWDGDTQGGGKSLAKALAAAAVELLTWLTFKVGSAALKGAKTVAKGVSKGAQSLAKGASRAGKAIAGGVRRAGQYVIKQGKVLLKGIAGTALGRAAKRLDDFARGLLGKTRFKGFRIRV